MKKILIATGNKGKLKEILEVLDGLPFEFLSLNDFPKFADCEENLETFQENAALKAKYYFEKIGGTMPVLADDSGIIVDALKGELGIKTRRWGAGAKATDQEWIDFFLNRMEEIEDEKRSARFICAAAICLDLENIKTFQGETDGFITRSLEAEIMSGLPLSSCFKPLGLDKVYSALSVEEKNFLSHRGKAFGKLKEFITKK